MTERLSGGSVLRSRTSPIPDPAVTPRTRTSSLFTTVSGVAVTAALLTTSAVGARSLPERTAPPLTRPTILPASKAQPAERPRTPTTALIVQELRDKSGLTWDQLGRLLGVSRRAVHLWAAGGRINARHLELLTRLRGIVDGLPAEDAPQRRVLLFETRQAGLNIFDAFLSQHASAEGTVAGTPFAPDQLLGARHDEDGSD
jgi:transcriptional regulator with XRE-family HTH domain